MIQKHILEYSTRKLYKFFALIALQSARVIFAMNQYYQFMIQILRINCENRVVIG